MTKHTSLAIALTATTFLCTPAVASSLTPTLDALKSEAGSVLPSVNQTYNLSELSGDLPTGAVKVEIGGKDYYFMPSGDNAGLLTTLAGTSAGMLKESSDGLFELDGKKYGFDVASIPDSAFSYSEGSEDDYNFSMSEADAEGKLTTQYYKIDLKPEAFATSKNISWTAVSEDQKDAADVVAVQLPNDQTKYFKYTYTRVPDRTIYNTPQNSLSGDVNADFIGSFNESNGGAIRNINTSIDNITGDFIGNSTGSDYGHGGAIYINNGKVNNITGDFIGNSLNGNYANGGAIHNSFHSIIGNISGDFISNFSQHYGGAIYNDGSSIGKINSNFIGNYVYNFDEHSSVYGGAIYNVGTIGDITGDFIGNYVSSSGSYTYGGAVSNSDSGIIGNITGDFIGNITKRYGAAIYNKDHSLIGNITGNFIGNKMAESSADGSGVAIYNDYSAIKNINGNFINNTSTNASGSWGLLFSILVGILEISAAILLGIMQLLILVIHMVRQFTLLENLVM